MENSLRGYFAIQEALEPVKKLADWQLSNRPDMKVLRCRRKDYDLFKRWPKAGAAQATPIRYSDDGRMTFMGLELLYDKTSERYPKKAA